MTLRAIPRWLHNDLYSYGLRRDLTAPADVREPVIPVTIRPIESADAPAFTEIDRSRHDREATRIRFRSALLLASPISTCYVAITNEGDPCYMQYLIFPSENDNVEKFFEGVFPRLGEGEALLEAAYTLEDYRGQGIMPFVMEQLAQEARRRGARWLLTFVDTANLPSLKGCKRAGFVPYLVRHQQRRLFRRRITFTPLPEETPYPFEAAEGLAEARSARPPPLIRSRY